MHALRILGLGIVLGLLLVGIAARQDPTENLIQTSYRHSYENPGGIQALTQVPKMELAKKWLQQKTGWSLFG